MVKTFVWIGVFAGSIVGSFIPMLWGGGMLSVSSFFWSSVGAVVGLVIGYKVGKLVQ